MTWTPLSVWPFHHDGRLQQERDQLRKFFWRKGNKTIYLKNNAKRNLEEAERCKSFESDPTFASFLLSLAMKRWQTLAQFILICVFFSFFKCFQRLLYSKRFCVILFVSKLHHVVILGSCLTRGGGGVKNYQKKKKRVLFLI